VCWNWFAPRTFANQTGDFALLSYDPTRRLATFGDARSDAVTVMALASAPSEVQQPAGRGLPLRLVYSAAAAASPVSVSVVAVFGRAGDPTLAPLALQLAADVDRAIDVEARADRQARFEAAFTPGNSVFSGHLPTLSLTDADQDGALARQYYFSVLCGLDLERRGPPFTPDLSTRVWITGSAENTTTNSFFWDFSYMPTVLVMLDPDTVRNMVTLFLQPQIGGVDALAGWGIDWMSGHGVGAWYAANDFSLFSLGV
jgi:hypothetical protein